MADNTRLSAGTADGATIATDDDGTAHHQYVKVEFGANNTQTPVTAAAPLPVSIGDGTDAALVTAAGELNTLDKNSAAALTALQLIDDPVATLGTTTYTETTTKGMIMGAVRRDADTTLADTTNEIAPLQVDANGYLKVEIFDGGASHTVDNNGTFVTQVDGAALTALQLIDDPVATLGTTTYTEAATKGMIIGAVRRDADTTLVDTTNEVGPLQMDANGRLKVEAFSGEALPVTLTSTTVTGTVAVTQSGTWDEVGINDSGNSITVDNGGTFATQVDGAALTALQKIDDPVLVDDAGFTPATSSVMMAGFQADETATDSVDEGDAGAGRMTLDRKQIVTLQPHTSGGMLCFNSIDLDETEEDVKTSAGQVYSITAFNRTAAPLYLRFYNATAANTTVGSTAAHVGPFLVPANADSDGAGFVWNNDHGFAFDTAICAAVTTGIAANDTGAPGANDCLVVVGYK